MDRNLVVKPKQSIQYAPEDKRRLSLPNAVCRKLKDELNIHSCLIAVSVLLKLIMSVKSCSALWLHFPLLLFHLRGGHQQDHCFDKGAG